MEVYFEQSILNSNIEKHAKRTAILSALRYFLLFLIGAAIVLFFFLPVDENNKLNSILTGLVLPVAVCIPLILGFVLIGKFIAVSNLEYDYVLNGSSFKVVKIVNRKKRKVLLDLSVACIESVGSTEAQAYDRYALSKDVKKVYALTDVQDAKSVYYIFCVQGGDKHLLLFAPNQEMIMALKRSINRITAIDKTFRYRED